VLLFGTPWWDGIGRTQAKSMTLGKGLAALLVILAATLALAWLIDKYQHASIAESTRRRLRAVMVGMLIVVFSIAW